MNTTNKIMLAAGIGVIVGVGGAFAYVHTGESEVGEGGHRMSDGTLMRGPMNMRGDMDAMMSGLVGKTGDDFDKEFLSEMIVHHAGAVAMAQEVLKTSTRPELKAMAEAIISAQTKEIDQMKAWQTSWFGK